MTRGRPAAGNDSAEHTPAKAVAASGKAAASEKTTPRKAPARKAPARKASVPKAPAAAAPPDLPPTPASAPTTRSATPVPAPASLGGAAHSRSGWRVLGDPSSPSLVYVAVVAVVAGFALLFVAWSEVAAQSDVWRQMPFVLSAGFPGLGLIMTGLVTASVGVRRQEGARRQRQMAALTEALRSVEEQVR